MVEANAISIRGNNPYTREHIRLWLDKDYVDKDYVDEAIEEIVTKRVEVADTVTEQELLPNTLYIFKDRVSALTITLGETDPDKADLFNFIIKTGTTAPTVTWPVGLTWSGGSAPTIDVSKSYDISILEGLAVAQEF